MRRVNIGWALAAWLFASVLIAFNRGIDLLWGMVMLLLSALLVAWCLPHLQVRRVSVRRRVPQSGISGEASELEYELTVTGPLPCFGVELRDRADGTDDLVPVAYFRVLRGRSVHRLRWTPPVRGIWRFDEVVLESRFPLGISRAALELDIGERSMTVYPGVARLRYLPADASTEPHVEHLAGGRRGGRDEFFGTRYYRPGDDPRSVNWRATARTGQLVLREFERPPDRRLHIVLDLDTAGHVGRGAASTHEYMFRIANSVALRSMETAAATGLLWMEGNDLRRLEVSTGPGAHGRIRETLAIVPLTRGVPVGAWLTQYQSRLPRGGQWLVFNAAGPTHRDSLIRVAHHCGAQPVIVEFDVGSFALEGTGSTAIRTFLQGHVRTHVVSCGADITRLFAPTP